MSDNNLFRDNEVSDTEFDNISVTREETALENGTVAEADDDITEVARTDNPTDDDHNGSQVTEKADFTPDFIEYTPPKPVTDPQNKKGIKVFVCLIAAALVLTAVATLGYLAGKNSLFNNSGNLSLKLESKPTNTDSYTAEQVYEITNKSVVGIAVYNSEGIQGYASGVIYSEDGYIITNDHIYDGISSPEFKIYTYDGNIYTARYIAGDTRSDLAVLKVDSSGFYPATFGNSDELKYGEAVVAIGRPSDATSSSSITGGYISFLNRRVSNSTNYASRLIQTDCAINPGSSGGALVNMYGQIIGITSSKLVGSNYEGVGYAIPSTTVKIVVDELITNGTVTTRAKLGVTYTEIDAVTAEINGTDITGLLIAEVNEESSLYGKINAGDVITAVNDEKITKSDIILDAIEAAKPGDVIKLTVYISSSNTYRTIDTKLVQAESSSSYESGIVGSSGSSPNNNGETFDFPYGY